MKIIKAGKVLTSEALNAEMIVSENTRKANENARNVWEKYNNAKSYVKGNKVEYNGSSYVCIQNATGKIPTNYPTYWQLIAAAGAGLTDASQLPITDTGNYYTVDNTGDALQEVGQRIGDLNQLETTSNTDLVVAVNEVNNKIGQQTVDLFTMSGQSNMQGVTEAEPAPFEIPKYKAYEYKFLTDSLTTVKHPFGEDVDNLLLPAGFGWGSPPPKFAEAYFKTTGIAPLMVSACMGATTVEDWMKAGRVPARYSKLVEKTNAAVDCAIENNLIVRNRYFVWLQGESDGIEAVDRMTYKTRFLQLWKDLKTDCGFNKCLIIRVAKYFEHPVLPIIVAQEELANENDDIIMLTRITGTFTTVNGYMRDIWHYSNSGCDLAGSAAGTMAGKYVNSGVRPALETEPYTEIPTATNGTYSWSFRTGAVVGDIVITAIGVPDPVTGYVNINDTSGYKLSKKIVLDGDATLSITCAITNTARAGAMFFTYDGNTLDDFVFMYLIDKYILLAGQGDEASRFTEASEIIPTINTYNHFVIQKSGSTYSLYINGRFKQFILGAPDVLNINSLFYGISSLSLGGKVKHVLISKGAILTPNECDPTFYANNEQGTT